MATTGQGEEGNTNVGPDNAQNSQLVSRDEYHMDNTLTNHFQKVLSVIPLMKNFEVVAVAGRAFAESLPSIRQQIRNCEKEQLEIETLARESEHRDPEVSVEINDLKYQFRGCIVKAKRFLKVCVEMALYGNDDKIHKAMEKELNQGKLNELKGFIELLLKRLKMCRSSMDAFEAAYKDTRQKAQNCMKKYKDCVNSTTGIVKEAKTKHFAATSSGDKAIDIQIASGIGIASAVVIGGVGIAMDSVPLTITAIAVGAVGAMGLVGARLYQRQPEITRATEKIVIAENVAQETVFENALKFSEDLQKEMNKIKHQINQMWEYANEAHDEVDNLTTDYLGPPERSPTTVAECRGILHDLKSLRSSMNSIQDELGPSGERISSGQDEVIVSNTEAVQPTDNQETMNERNPLDVHTSPPESIEETQGGPPPIIPIPVENTGGTTFTNFIPGQRSQQAEQGPRPTNQDHEYTVEEPKNDDEKEASEDEEK